MYKGLTKCLIITTCSLFSVIFSMDEESMDKNQHYLNAQEYFKIAQECSLDEIAEKNGFLTLAIEELENGVRDKDVLSICWMKDFYKNGLAGIVQVNMEEYKKLDQIIQSQHTQEKNEIATPLKEKYSLSQSSTGDKSPSAFIKIHVRDPEQQIEVKNKLDSYVSSKEISRTRSIAENLLTQGVSIEIITKCTGLSKEEVIEINKLVH